MAISNISVNDATTPTPVAHVFVPIQDGSDARYVNDAGAQTIKGQETIGLSIKRASTNGSAQVARATMYDPKEVSNGDGTYTVSHGNSSDCRFNFSPMATEQERLDLMTMTIALLSAKKSDMCKLLPQL